MRADANVSERARERHCSAAPDEPSAHPVAATTDEQREERGGAE